MYRKLRGCLKGGNSKGKVCCVSGSHNATAVFRLYDINCSPLTHHDHYVFYDRSYVSAEESSLDSPNSESSLFPCEKKV